MDRFTDCISQSTRKLKMPKVIFTRGIQGSGKSYWAKQYCLENQDWIRVSRDDLRHMRGKYWLPKQEDLITDFEEACIEFALRRGHNVIIDAMNLNPKTVDKMRTFITGIVRVYELGEIEIRFKDFTNTPLETCIKRDMERPNSIGEKVIRKTYEKYLAPKIEPYKPDSNLPHAIICDLDGTLALFGDKNPYERDFINDRLNEAVDLIIRNYMAHNVVDNLNRNLIIFSGRSDRFKDETKQWLNKYWITPSIFEMRTEAEEKAQIKDVKVKERMFESFIRGKYNIDFVLDDRNQVVELWRKLGLTCLQVADGDF